MAIVRTFELKAEIPEGTYSAPQMLAVIAGLKQGSKPVEFSKLVERVHSHMQKKEIRGDANRVTALYTSILVKDGYVTKTREVPEKPAPAAKTTKKTAAK